MDSETMYIALLPPMLGAIIPYMHQENKELNEQKSKALHDYLNAIATMIVNRSEINTEELSKAKILIADRYKMPRSMFPIGDDALQAAYMQWLSSDNIPLEYKREFQRQNRLIEEEFIKNDVAVPNLKLPIAKFATKEFCRNFRFLFGITNCAVFLYLLSKGIYITELNLCTFVTLELMILFLDLCISIGSTIGNLLAIYSLKDWKAAVLHRDNKQVQKNKDKH